MTQDYTQAGDAENAMRFAFPPQARSFNKNNFKNNIYIFKNYFTTGS